MRKLNLQVNDYQAFYRFILQESVNSWLDCTSIKTADSNAMLHRIYWYVLGHIDYIKTEDQKFKTSMKEHFDRDKELKRNYMALAGQKLKPKDSGAVYAEAWKTCFMEAEDFYKNKADLVRKLKSFYYTVRSSTNFIDIVECGHWKVDFLHKSVSEKGLDTKLAVDMVALADQYDIALLISGDADSIPSINYAKRLGKQVAAVEFIKGHPPEKRGKQFSSRIKAASDFVVQIFEMDLLRNKIAIKPQSEDDLLK